MQSLCVHITLSGRRVVLSILMSGTIALTVLFGTSQSARADSINQLASWGYGTYGELGNGSTSSSPVPVSVTTSGVLNGKTISQVSSGRNMTCVLDTAGLAYCWGGNSDGQLGNGTTTSSNVPVVVSMPDGVRFSSISVGAAHVCAVSTTGAGYCWGWSGQGELGGATPVSPFTVTTPQPVTMPTGKTFRSISAGNRYTCAVTTDNLGYCWGLNGDSQLGIGSGSGTGVPPTQVAGSLSFRIIEAGSSTTCGLTTSDAAYCWGLGGFGQLGNNSTTTEVSAPVAVSTTGGLPDTYASLTSGTLSDFFCGLTSSGEAWCWGQNSNGQLGNGTTTDAQTPVQVNPVASRTYSAISTGWDFACAVTNLGEAYCWGNNANGRLGDNTITSKTTPTAVSTNAVLQYSQISAIASGESSTFIIAVTVPGSPTSVNATAGTESASVSWTAPASNGGTAITGYTVTSNPGSRTCTTTGTSCTVTGLSGGTSYEFTVTATNARGSSLASVASNAVTPTANSGGGGGSAETPANTTTTPTVSSTPAETITTPVQTTQVPLSPADKLATGDVNDLSSAELRSLPASAFSTASRATMARFTRDQVSVLSKSQLRAVTPFALKGLTPAVVKGLTAKQLSGLTPKQKAAFTEEQRAAMTDKQRKALQSKKRST